MAKLKFGASSVQYGDLDHRDKEIKRNRRLMKVAILLTALNLTWSVLNHQDEIKYNYNKLLEKVKEMRK